MKAFLQLTNGVYTRKIYVPDKCYRTTFRLPLKTSMALTQINSCQEILETPPSNVPVLEFRFKGKELSSVPVFELERIIT